jgi:TonB family protein
MRPRILCTALVMVACGVTTAAAYVLTEEQARKLAISTPPPQYPYAARLHHVEGQGVFLLRVQIRTGLVKAVIVEHSTGSKILDGAALSALKRWRFKPGVLPSISVELPKQPDSLAKEDSFVRVPVNFVMRRRT